MGELKAAGDPAVKARNASQGAGDDHFGVRMGDLRAIAKKFKSDHGLAMPLSKSGNAEAGMSKPPSNDHQWARL